MTVKSTQKVNFNKKSTQTVEKEKNLEENINNGSIESLSASFETALKRREYPVPTDIGKILKKITKGDPAMYDTMVAIVGSESNFKNVKSHSNARGYGQFVDSTLLEVAYLNKNDLPAKYKKIAEKYITQTTDKKGRVRYSCSNMSAVRKLATEAEPGLILCREYLKYCTKYGHRKYRGLIQDKIDAIKDNHDPVPQDRLDELNYQLNRPWTNVDLKTCYMCGIGAGPHLLAAYAETRSHGHKAEDYLKKWPWVAGNNKNVFFVQKNGATTVATKTVRERVPSSLKDFIENDREKNDPAETVNGYIKRMKNDKVFNPDFNHPINAGRIEDGLSEYLNILQEKLEAVRAYDDIPATRLNFLEISQEWTSENGLSDWQKKIVLMLGAEDGAKMLGAYADRKSRGFPVTDYISDDVLNGTFKKTVERKIETKVANPKKGAKVPRSVKEYMEYMEKRVGDQELSNGFFAYQSLENGLNTDINNTPQIEQAPTSIA